MTQKGTEVAKKDAYLENITAQINEINEQIRASNKKLYDKKEELEMIKKHYVAFQKSFERG